MKLKRKKVKLTVYENEFLIFPALIKGEKYWLEWCTVKYYYSPVFKRYFKDKIVSTGKRADEFNKKETETVYKDVTIHEYIYGEQQ